LLPYWLRTEVDVGVIRDRNYLDIQRNLVGRDNRDWKTYCNLLTWEYQVGLVLSRLLDILRLRRVQRGVVWRVLQRLLRASDRSVLRLTIFLKMLVSAHPRTGY
jgi:hypothetical protein